MNESAFWEKIRELGKGYFTFQRLEVSTGLGVPDLIVLSETGIVTFAELKIHEKKKDGKIKLPLRPGQAAWCFKWAQGGGRAGFLSTDSDNSEIFWFPALTEFRWVKTMHQSFNPGEIEEVCSTDKLDMKFLYRIFT